MSTHVAAILGSTDWRDLEGMPQISEHRNIEPFAAWNAKII